MNPIIGACLAVLRLVLATKYIGGYALLAKIGHFIGDQVVGAFDQEIAAQNQDAELNEVVEQWESRT